MANQKAILRLVDLATGKTVGVRVTLVDSDGGAATFTDYGASSVYTVPSDMQLLDVVGQGVTAPATATAFQFGLNGGDVQAYAIGAAIYDPTSTPEGRIVGIGSLNPIPKGSAVRITGRA